MRHLYRLLAAASALCWLPTALAEVDWRMSLQKAMTTQQAGDLVGAAPHYRAAMAEHAPLREHPAVLTNFGLAAQAEGALTDAIDAFRAVLERTPEDCNAHYNLGNALAEQGTHSEAVEAFRECLKLNPTDAEAHYMVGVSLLRGSPPDAEAAMDALQTSIAIAPADAKVHVSLGDALMQQQSWAASAASYREAATIRPAHAGTWASLGYVQEELGELEAAEASWRRAIHLDPSEGASSYTNLGAMFRRQDRLNEARAAYTAALATSPSAVEAYNGLGRTFQVSRGASAQQAAEEYKAFLSSTYSVALRLQPTSAETYVAVGEGLRMYGIHEPVHEVGGHTALQMYEFALALAPSNTCAATHVAFGGRAPSSAEEVEALMGCEDALIGAEDGSGDVGADDGALLGHGRRAVGATIDELSVSAPPTDGATLADARDKWRRHGLVVFPKLLSAKSTAALLQYVRAAQHGNHTRDYTAVTRDKGQGHRCHKALPVREAAPALDEIAAKLGVFLEAALGTPAPHILESGFMVTAPGASAQLFHRDVAPAVVSASSVTVSIQISLVDTAATQGALEVIPGSHGFDPSISEHDRQEALPHVPVAVPAGTVTIYALHTMHRGSANTHTADRPFYFFSLIGNGLAPPGLAYTIEPDDIGRWQLGGKVLPAAAA